MADLTPKQSQMAVAAGLHLAAAAAGLIAIAAESGEPAEQVRMMYLRICREMWDETVQENGLG